MYKLKKEGLVNDLSPYFVTHQAMENYPITYGNFGDIDDYSGEVDSSALIRALVFEEPVTGERNALSMFSVGEHVFERDQLDTGANGTVLGLRRRNMDPDESRAVLRIATETAGGQVPVGSGGGFGHHGGNIAWQGVRDDGVTDQDMGFLGFHWHTVAAGNMLAEFWMGVNGDNTAFLMRANNDNILFDELGTGVNVGIGTSSPDYLLHVNGSNDAIKLSSTSPRVLFEDGSSGDWYLQVINDHRWRFQTPSASEALTVLKGGNVGVGTGTPEDLLSLHRTPSATEGDLFLGFAWNTAGQNLWGFRLDATTYDLHLDRNFGGGWQTPIMSFDRSSGNVGIGTSSPGGLFTVYSTASVNTAGSNASLRLQNAFSGGETLQLTAGIPGVSQAGFSINNITQGTIPFVVESGGNVGIGTSNPSYPLHVREVTAGGNVALFENASGNGVYVFNVNASGDPRFQINDNGGNRFFEVLTDGKVGIGAGTPSNLLSVGASGFGGTTYALFVTQAAGGAWAARFQNNTGNGGNGIVIHAGDNSNPNEYYVYMQDGGGTNVGEIVGDGAGGINYVGVSDERQKQDITPLGASLDRVLALRPVSYRGKGADRRKRKTPGFIAQEVMDVIPEAAHYDEETDLYGLAWNKLIPVMWGAIQELNQKIEELS